MYLEVDGLQKLVRRHMSVLGLSRISIAQEDVMQPVRHNCVFIHQVTDAFQHRLEVVFLHVLINTVSVMTHQVKAARRGGEGEKEEDSQHKFLHADNAARQPPHAYDSRTD